MDFCTPCIHKVSLATKIEEKLDELKQESSKEISVVKDVAESKAEKVQEKLGSVADTGCKDKANFGWVEMAKRHENEALSHSCESL